MSRRSFEMYEIRQIIVCLRSGETIRGIAQTKLANRKKIRAVRISERYERASTIVTSNLDFSEWGGAFPNQLLAAATLDRLRHNAHKIVLEGASFRGAKESKSTKSTDAKEQKLNIAVEEN